MLVLRALVLGNVRLGLGTAGKALVSIVTAAHYKRIDAFFWIKPSLPSQFSVGLGCWNLCGEGFLTCFSVFLNNILYSTESAH